MMAKKKKYITYEGMSYTPKIIKAFSPSKWGAGEWEYDKETDIWSFSGEDKREMLGYQVVMMGVQDGNEFTVTHSFSKTVFESREKAKAYFERYHSDIIAGNNFNDKNAGYPSGVINDFSL